MDCGLSRASGGLIIERGINIVEVDLTRSTRRMINPLEHEGYSYSAVVFRPDESPRMIGMHYGEPLKRIALPLHGEVIGVDLQAAYDYGYQSNTAAAHLDHENFYEEHNLPFPSLLTQSQRHEALETVNRWRDELKRLAAESA